MFFRNNEEIKIYITGGSQGAEYINQTVPLIFKNLPYELKIRHQCGKDKLEKVKDLYKSNEINAEVNEFYKNPNSSKQKILFQSIIAFVSMFYLYYSAEIIPETSFIVPFLKDLVIPIFSL